MHQDLFYNLHYIHIYLKEVHGNKSVKVKLSLKKAVEAHRFETSRLLYFLENRLIDGGEIVRLKRRPPFTPRKILGTHFC
jgi:hypothetical protein